MTVIMVESGGNLESFNKFLSIMLPERSMTSLCHLSVDCKAKLEHGLLTRSHETQVLAVTFV